MPSLVVTHESHTDVHRQTSPWTQLSYPLPGPLPSSFAIVLTPKACYTHLQPHKHEVRHRPYTANFSLPKIAFHIVKASLELSMSHRPPKCWENKWTSFIHSFICVCMWGGGK